MAIVAENNYVWAAHIDADTTSITGDDGQAQVYQPCEPPPVTNAGLEGMAFRRPAGGSPGRIYVCQEYKPMRVMSFEHELGTPPFELKSYADGTLKVDEPWDADQVFNGVVGDVAGMTYDESTGTLLIVSQESSSVIRVVPDTGDVLDSLALQNTTTSEGIALYGDCELAVVSEPNQIQIYSP
jgi:uncharacterized protein YjiK